MDAKLLGERIDATIASFIHIPGGPDQIPPHAMEKLLMLLDAIRISIMSDDVSRRASHVDYPQYISARGFGTLRVTTRLLPQPTLSQEDILALEKLNSIWRDYLIENNRFPHPSKTM